MIILTLLLLVYYLSVLHPSVSLHQTPSVVCHSVGRVICVCCNINNKETRLSPVSSFECVLSGGLAQREEMEQGRTDALI